MHPKTTREELPTCNQVRVAIMNYYVDYLANLRTMIEAAPGLISVNWDLWTKDHTSEPFFGMMCQWIEVRDGRWVLRVEVVAFHRVYGDHSGNNLGRYAVKLMDCAGITSRTRNLVRHSLCSTCAAPLKPRHSWDG